MGGSVFSGCTSLTSVVIPDSVTGGYYNSFDYMFEDCTSLTAVTLPTGVKSLGRNMFDGCTALTEITVPEGVERLSQTFNNCPSLTTLNLPASLREISSNTFYNCLNLKTVTFAGTETQWGAVSIADGNAELKNATVTCTGVGSPTDPDNPDTPDNPDNPDTPDNPDNPDTPDNPDNPNPPDTPNTPAPLPADITNGGLGRRVTVQVAGGHWLTVQVLRAGTISITSVQAPGSGTVSLTFSAAAGSSVQIWETAEEMDFASGAPVNPILAVSSYRL